MYTGSPLLRFCAHGPRRHLRLTRPRETSFNVAWSIYVGWMPWDYADRSGILKKWADKYGIKIKLTQINDYVESINQYTAGGFDACVMTNMDMLTIPAAGGVDSTALIVGDFSNGNDGVVLKGKGKTLADIKGQKVNLVELSVSHYLADARPDSSVGLRERDVKIVNTSDADIVGAFATPASTAVVTWKPQLSAVLVGAQRAARVRLDEDSRGNHRPDGGQHGDACRQSETRQGTWWAPGTKRSRSCCKTMPAGAAALAAMAKASGTDCRGFPSATRDDALVRHARGCLCLHDRRGAS